MVPGSRSSYSVVHQESLCTFGTQPSCMFPGAKTVRLEELVVKSMKEGTVVQNRATHWIKKKRRMELAFVGHLVASENIES